MTYAVRLLGYEGQTIREMLIPDYLPSIDLAVPPALMEMSAAEPLPMYRIAYQHTNTAGDGTLIYRQRRLEFR